MPSSSSRLTPQLTFTFDYSDVARPAISDYTNVQNPFAHPPPTETNQMREEHQTSRSEMARATTPRPGSPESATTQNLSGSRRFAYANLEDGGVRARVQSQSQRERDNTDLERNRERHREEYLRAREQAHAVVQTGGGYSRGTSSAARHLAETGANAPSQSRERSPRKSGDQQHRVYLVNCKSCGSFLTDRGMKAVLLLKPHITLFSTDAVPNCGPLYPPSRFAASSSPEEPMVERTCDCLTQTLGCLGCGAPVGYHIVSPCSRCTNSVAKHQRSSNGHRTVLHCAEIAVRERRYVPGEPGVSATSPAAAYLAANHRAANAARAAASYARGREDRTVWRPPLSTFQSDGSDLHNMPNRTLPEAWVRRIQTDPDGEHVFEEMNLQRFHGQEDDGDLDKMDVATHQAEMANQFLQFQLQHQQQRQEHSYNLSQAPPSLDASQARFSTSKKEPRVMKRGDVVYWSDLISCGERCEPIDAEEMLDMPVAGR